MATYTELFEIYSNSAAGAQDLLNKITAAVLIAADLIRAEDPGTANHANRILWARQAFISPQATAHEMFGALLAANNTFTAAQILGATDTGIQTAVTNAINVFATGGA